MRRARRWTALLLAATVSATVLVGMGVVGAPASAGAWSAPTLTTGEQAAAPPPAVDYVNECPVTAAPGHYTCYALRRTDGAYRRPAVSGGQPAGYAPGDLQSAYQLPPTAGAVGSGPTVYVIDAYGYPNAESDLATYRARYGLEPCSTANGCFRKIDQSGGMPTAAFPPYHAGWAAESALDLAMVSAICPLCKITLIESYDDTDNLFRAVELANTLGAEFVSMSWGGAETGSERSYDATYLNRTGVVYAASSGDGAYGAGVSYPSTSPNVVAVGGTSLSRSAGPRGWSEAVWASDAATGTGSGCSRDEATPAWQRIIAPSVCPRRAGNDVAAVADPNTGVAVYVNGAWDVFGGTSASAPIIASIYARAGSPGAGDHPGSYPYANRAALNDVIVGHNGACSAAPLCTAGAGWDGPTGLGTPKGLLAFQQPGHAVTVTNPDVQYTALGDPVNLQIVASQVPAGGVLTFTATGLPTGLSISASGLVSGRPTAVGTATTTVTATDAADNASSAAGFGWVVGRAGTFIPVKAARLLDTRSGNGAPVGKVRTNTALALQVTGRAGIPAVGVSSVVLNVTATEPVGPGYVTAYADGANRPVASNLDYSNFTVPNLVTVPVGSNGRIRLYVSVSTHLLADVTGYYLSGTPKDAGTFVPLNPVRFLDTRTGLGAPKAPIQSLSTVAVQITGRGAVPAKAKVSAVVLNIAETGARSAGYLTVYPGGNRPLASNVDFSAGITVANLVTVPVDAGGRIRVFVLGGGGLDVFADVLGYYTSGIPTVPGSFGALSPARLLDTRTGVGGSHRRLVSGDTVLLRVTGVGGVPTGGVSAVVLNVHAVEPSAAGYVTVHADGTSLPPTSNLNYSRSRSVANLVIVPVGTDGSVALTVIGGQVDLVADVTGYYRS